MSSAYRLRAYYPSCHYIEMVNISAERRLRTRNIAGIKMRAICRIRARGWVGKVPGNLGASEKTKVVPPLASRLLCAGEGEM